jgi:hypothetical protein
MGIHTHLLVKSLFLALRAQLLRNTGTCFNNGILFWLTHVFTSKNLIFSPESSFLRNTGTCSKMGYFFWLTRVFTSKNIFFIPESSVFKEYWHVLHKIHFLHILMQKSMN